MTNPTLAIQTALPFTPPELNDSDKSNHGAVFTRSWVVDFILELCGYEPTADLCDQLLIEPACGDGAFLGPITERLLRSCKVHGRKPIDAIDAVRAFDLQLTHVERSRDLVISTAVDAGTAKSTAQELAHAWVRHGDFLLTTHDEETADFVVGNPPYIRLEDMSKNAFMQVPALSHQTDLDPLP